MSTNQKLWPSQTTSTTRATKSTYKPATIRTDWAGGFLTFAMILLIVAAVLGGLYFLVLEDVFSQLQTLKDSLSGMQLVSAVSK